VVLVSTVMRVGFALRFWGLLCANGLREVSLGKMFCNGSARCFLVDTPLRKWIRGFSAREDNTMSKNRGSMHLRLSEKEGS
jgi:hypothetical protein